MGFDFGCFGFFFDVSILRFYDFVRIEFTVGFVRVETMYIHRIGYSPTLCSFPEERNTLYQEKQTTFSSDLDYTSSKIFGRNIIMPITAAVMAVTRTAADPRSFMSRILPSFAG